MAGVGWVVASGITVLSNKYPGLLCKL